MRRVSMVILLGICLSFVSRAQQALSLNEAITIGLENNFDILLQQEQHKVAELNNTLLNTGMFPQITGVVNGGDRYSSVDNTNNPFTFFAGKVNTNTLTATPGIQLNWRLFNGLRGFATKERLELLEEQSGGQVDVVIENTIQAIILAYFQGVMQQEQLRVLQETANLSRSRMIKAQNARDLGVQTTFEVLRLQSLYYTDSVNVLQQQLAVREAHRQLNTLLAVEEEVEYRYTDGLVSPGMTVSKAELEEDMLADNQSLVNQFITLQLQENAIKNNRGQFMPTLDVQGGWDYNFNRTRVLEPDQTARSTTLGFYINFSLQFNLFNSGAAFRAMEQAQIEKTLAQIGLDQLTFTLKKQMASAYDRFEQLNRVLGVQQLAVDEAYYQLELAKDRYDRGLLTSFDYRDIQLQYLRLELSRLQTLYNVTEAQAQLLKLSGGILSYVP